MMLFFVIFAKRPHYALGFLPFIFMCFIALLQGNSFLALALLFFSCLFWCYLSLTLYISDKNVNTTLFGVDLKIYVPVAFWIIGIYGVLLTLFWILVMVQPISLFSINAFMIPLFWYALIAILGGKGLLLSSMIVKMARSDFKMDKPSGKRLLGEIKNLIAQP
jgi:hypothetical protein